MQPELHRTTNAGRSLDGGPALRLVRLAVAVGFEPTEACTSHAFEACSFGRSDTLPPRILQEPGCAPAAGPRTGRTAGPSPAHALQRVCGAHERCAAPGGGGRGTWAA